MRQFLPVVLLGLLTTSAACQRQSLSETTFPSVVAGIKKALVHITVGTDTPGELKTGTGFVIADNEKVVVISTCYHVLFERTKNPDSVEIIPDTSQVYAKFSTRPERIPAHYIAGREDRDIALLAVFVPSSKLLPTDFAKTTPAKLADVVEGLDVGSTGYECNIMTSEFGKVQQWAITRRGVVSSAHWVNPTDTLALLDYFYVDMMITPGGSGSPVYDAQTGNIIGMFNKFLHFGDSPEKLISLSQCVPVWAIVGVWQDFMKEKQKN